MTLTEAAYWTRKFTVLFIVFIIIIFIGWQVVALANPKPKIPERYLIPNELCSTEPLPALQIYSLNIPVEFSNLEIETATGRYPDLPKIVNVYKIEYRGGSLAARDMAISIAESLGFDPETIKRKSSNEYQFDNTAQGKTLIIENSNQHFVLKTEMSHIQNKTEVMDNKVMIDTASRILMDRKLLPKTVDENLTRVTYLVKAASSFNTTESRISAHAARIDFFKSKELIAVEEQYINSKELGEFLREKLPDSPKKRIRTEDGDIEVHSYSVPLVPDSPYSSHIYITIADNKITGKKTRKYI